MEVCEEAGGEEEAFGEMEVREAEEEEVIADVEVEDEEDEEEIRRKKMSQVELRSRICSI